MAWVRVGMEGGMEGGREGGREGGISKVFRQILSIQTRERNGGWKGEREGGRQRRGRTERRDGCSL